MPDGGSRIEPRQVVIVGGGIAALEAVLALHDLGEGRLALTLIAPHERFVLKPLAAGEPFGRGPAPTLALADVMAEHGGRFVRDSVVGVDVEARRLRCAHDDEIAYDELLLVVGARPRRAYEHVISFDGDPAPLRGLVADVEQGYSRSVAFVVPPGLSWPLPIYELALMTAEAAWSMGIDDIALTIVSPEPRPLALFGTAPSNAVAELLDAAGIRFAGGVEAQVGEGRVWLGAGGEQLAVDRVVALARLEGPDLPGVPHDDAGFIPVDEFGRVKGANGVRAAGDATDLLVKHGGVACQLADVAAAGIAAAAGAAVEVRPLRAVLRGRLLTGRKDRFLSKEGGAPAGEVSTEPLWWPPAKVSGRYLAAYLEGDAEPAAAPPPPGIDVELALYTPPLLDPGKLGLDPYGPIGGAGRWPRR